MLETIPTDRFPKTQWSVVLRGAGDDKRAALGTLCQAYWYPVYAFLRRLGAKPADAADLTQGFFTSLVEHDQLKRVHPELGRFRSWLRSAAKHYYLNAVDAEKALKRGGKAVKLPFDAPGAEVRLGLELMHTLTPERLFDQCWARTVTDRALSAFRAECASAEELELMLELCDELKGERSEETRRADDAPKSGAQRTERFRQRERLKDRYRRLLRREILGTVDDSSAIDDEIRVLLGVGQ
jgi:RNA polymerase sigma-70 factor (ECF subfamily)